MDILTDSPFNPCLNSLFLYLRPTRRPYLFFCLYHSGLILSMATLSSLLRMPLSELGIWQGSGLFLIRFLFIPILGSSGLVAYLPDVSDTWWAQVSCCGSSLVGTLCWRNPSTITAPFVALGWYSALMLYHCLRGLHGFPIASFFSCVFDALLWADMVTRCLTALFISV